MIGNKNDYLLRNYVMLFSTDLGCLLHQFEYESLERGRALKHTE